MSRKRGAVGSGILTGGTNDVNPQFFRFNKAEGPQDANASTVVVSNTPIQAFTQGRGDRAIVMEVLKIFISADFQALRGLLIDSLWLIWVAVGSGNGVPNGAQGTKDGMSNQNSFASYHYRLLVPATTFGGNNDSQMGKEIDVTDSNGHGVLIATPQVTLSLRQETTGGSWLQGPIITCGMLYRFKEVDLTEYLGIVNSQQAPTSV